MQHHAAVHISVTFGIVCHVSFAAGKSSHFSIAFAVNALAGNIVELSKFIFSPLIETEVILLIVVALENVPNPTALNVKAEEICELSKFIFSAEAVVDDKGCPLDGDQDGVADYLDDELDSPDSSFVDEHGVAISDEMMQAWNDNTPILQESF